MWNQGAEWKQHVAHLAKFAVVDFDVDCIIEVGAGNGEFLEMIDSEAVKIAVDPAESVKMCEERGIHYVQEYFDPSRHLLESAGDILIVMRHLLEHMSSPRDFIDAIAEERREIHNETHVLIEVPCIENALDHVRLEDWTYEHPQHFTYASLEALMLSAGFTGSAQYAYNCEVLVYEGNLNRMPFNETELHLDNFSKLSLMAAKIGGQLAAMDSVAYWGGAGKSAMFINYLGVLEDAVVVDSDPDKVGLYVPGTKIKIQDPDKLLLNPVDTIVITTSWRAQDIACEIKRRNIPCTRLLTFDSGNLVEVK
jgi:hypothetical protein